MKVARIVTIPAAFVHIREVLGGLSKEADVHLVSSGPGDLPLPWHIVEIPRDIALFKDAVALYKLFILFRQERFDIVHSSTPKAGLLTAVAGFLARVPVRLHTFTGQRWAGLSGVMRWLLIALDKLIGRLNTWTYADSPSQLALLRQYGILSPGRSACLGKGSFGGVHPGRFDLQELPRQRARTRRELGIGRETFVVIFIGSLNPDKGIAELVRALELLPKEIVLLLVGQREGDVGVDIDGNPAIVATGPQFPPDRFLAAADLLCLPSHREGFGTVVLEAALAKVPAVGTRITGLVDAIAEGETGLLCRPRDAADLADKIAVFYRDRSFLAACGCRARQRALQDFSCEVLMDAQLREYRRLLSQAGR